MAKRTTGQWQELLDDAEHGPWDFAADYGQVASKYALIAQEVDDHNAPLIAAAPEVVAEVVRLRRELEELRALYIKADYPNGGDWEKGKEHAYRRVLRDLTRILEGHNDE